MTPDKRVEEVRKEYRKFTLEMARSVSENGDYSKVEGMIVDWWLVKLTQDRAALHTSLVAAVKEKAYKPWDHYNDIPGEEEMVKLEDLLTTINSLFKE